MSDLTADRLSNLELDVDGRLLDLWAESASVETWTLEIAAAYMRAAYGKGYADALTEPKSGQLCTDHGYRVPCRRRP